MPGRVPRRACRRRCRAEQQHIPALFLELHLDTHLWNDHFDDALNTTQPFVLSNGDSTGVRGRLPSELTSSTRCMATGSTASVRRPHRRADRAEEIGFQEIIDTCTHGEALADCPVIKPIPVETINSCKKKPSTDETVIGTLSALPGGFAVRGPGNSPPTTPSGQSGDSVDPPPAALPSPEPEDGDSPKTTSVRPGAAAATKTLSPFLRQVCKPDL